MAAKETRSRNWTFLVLSDSEKLDPHWRDTLSEMGLQCALARCMTGTRTRTEPEKETFSLCCV